ncbi:MerR family transcriptional regulator [Tabrizicola sp. YIM 78059]|uniref:MerR family transcriptional regulator n=1 Tax=Tabrizicola sp. YIM 78059 TaxID=2529861 RepID=UPI0010A9C41C|nr:MerR family transcriptional regulator [Tabrizicola sp. YIM 78059]
MDKSPDAFRTISEVAEVLNTPAHVLRFWESRFTQVRPVKRAGGRRYYRPSDVALLAGIKRLLHDEGMTIRGVQKMLRDKGVRHVASLADGAVPLVGPQDAEEPVSAANWQDEVPEAGFIAVEDEDEEPEAAPPPAKPATRARPEQPSLPLFDAVVEVSPAAPAPKPAPAPPAPVAPAQRVQRDDVTLAGLIRALPAGYPGTARPEVAALARRLAALRARLADRAEGLG